MLNSLHIAKPPEDTRVVVAMSGGVDSSVTAGLLARQGYEVIGVTLQLYDHGAALHRTGSCCAGQGIRDARRVAAALGISHRVLDYTERFRNEVIEPFAESYARGETPVPCIACNKRVKFGDLMDVARDLGADALATGHYVRTEPAKSRMAMYRSVDTGRDQSYFLFAITTEQLQFLRFPLGGMSKPEVRDIARDMGLEVADKHDSQDICFVPQGHYAEVIRRLHPEAIRPGHIVHVDGRVLGRHEGIVNYTVGQRRGLGVAASEPLYVVGLDPNGARVIVGPRSALSTHGVRLREVNWLGEKPLGEAASGKGYAVKAKVRSTRPPKPAVVEMRSGEIFVTLTAGESGVAPGQACVFYADDSDGAEVLGGGFIVETFPSVFAA